MLGSEVWLSMPEPSHVSISVLFRKEEPTRFIGSLRGCVPLKKRLKKPPNLLGSVLPKCAHSLRTQDQGEKGIRNFYLCGQASFCYFCFSAFCRGRRAPWSLDLRQLDHPPSCLSDRKQRLYENCTNTQIHKYKYTIAPFFMFFLHKQYKILLQFVFLLDTKLGPIWCK